MKLSPFLAMAALPLATQAQTNKPNIILFLVDDMGWNECSTPFWDQDNPLNDRYRTPNMDKLAAKGVKFTQAYACAISSPSRCSLMSGMNAARHRVTNWTLKYNTNTDKTSDLVNLPDWNYNGIQPDTCTQARDLDNTTLCTGLPQILKDNGYYTIHCGKAHFGSRTTTSGATPEAFGFDVNIAGNEAGGPGSYLAADNYSNASYTIQGLDEYAEQGLFLTEALTQAAMKALQTPIDNNQPFYLYMSHYAIHVPYSKDERFASNYDNYYDPLIGDYLNQSEKNHAALIEGMDYSLGELLAFLEKQSDEVQKNTIILFMSDNGGQATSGVRQGTFCRTPMYPLRGGKGSAYLGGVREPMMVYWPGVTEAGTVNDNPVMIEDFFPTIIEMAGIDSYSTSQTVDGQSFVPIIKGEKTSTDRAFIWHFPNIWGESKDRSEGFGCYSAIIRGDYHLIYFWETQEKRLYNIREDISELYNIVDDQPELAASLAQQLTDSLKAYNAQRPTLKSTGELVPWPSEGEYTPAKGDVVTLSSAGIKTSDNSNTYYYTVEDHRATPDYWTLGTHNGYNALQCARSLYEDEEAVKQQFYFLAGPDSEHFLMMTGNGENTDYASGTMMSGWNSTATTTNSFLQYATTAQGQYQLVKSGYDDYYGFKTTGGLVNNRGTAKSNYTDLSWVVNFYSGNNVGDLGSIYKFNLVRSAATGITDAQANAPDATIYDLSGRKVNDKRAMLPGIYIQNRTLIRR